VAHPTWSLKGHVAQILQRKNAQWVGMPDDGRNGQRHLAEQMRDVDERQRREFDRTVVKREDHRRRRCQPNRPAGGNNAEVSARGRIAGQGHDAMFGRGETAAAQVLIDAAAL